MKPTNPALVARRLAALRGITNVQRAGSGTEFFFFIAAKAGRREGYRIPRTPEFNTSNNPGVPALSLQLQELKLAAWARKNGLPSAKPLDLVEQDGYPVLVLEVVDDDRSEVDSAALGATTANMHSCPMPSIDFVALNGQPTNPRIARRLNQRYIELSKHTFLPPLPPVAKIESELEGSLGMTCLTHLDIRRQNVRVQQGRPLSLFDWSNALPAPPELEIARVEEYAAIGANGLDYSAFREGYAKAGGVLQTRSAAWPVLRLDAAVMLAVVFSSVAPDEALRTLFVGRIRGLLKEL